MGGDYNLCVSEILVTYRSEAVALLIPVTRPSPQVEAQAWVEIDHLAAEIGARWPLDGSAESVAMVEQLAQQTGGFDVVCAVVEGL